MSPFRRISFVSPLLPLPVVMACSDNGTAVAGSGRIEVDQIGIFPLYAGRIVIAPHGLEGRFLSDDSTAQIQLMSGGSDGNPATIAMGYLLRILNSIAEKAMPAAVSGPCLPFSRQASRRGCFIMRHWSYRIIWCRASSP